MEPASITGAAAVAAVVKSSVLTATVTGALDALIQMLRRDGGEDDPDSSTDETEAPSAAGALAVPEDGSLLRSFRIGAGCLVACPIAFAAGASALLHVPWQQTLEACLISEVCFVPLVATAWLTEDDPQSALFRHAPRIAVLSTWGTFAVTYTVSVFVMHHRIALWPIISSTGDLPPESIVWTLGGLTTGVSLMAVARGWELGYVGQSAELRRSVRALTPLGYTSGLCLIGVGVFRSGATWTNVIHMPCAMVGWATMWVAMAYHTHLAWQVQPHPGAPRDPSRSRADVYSLRNTRAVCLLWSGMSAFGFASLFGYPILAAICEYSACVSWTFVLGTFIPEFGKGMVGAPPAAWGEAPADEIAVGGAFGGRREVPSRPTSRPGSPRPRSACVTPRPGWTPRGPSSARSHVPVSSARRGESRA
eukprot:TRINITY_DN70999_c0_g1_i1.p1 TRINITY_DN70999_c0_g1~~TRINITY_DN70999_c0_g1_i1.p1  ORF type:complete len:452 (+),score=116.03 TRINITY_DN70999_c0_g1_i1:95-1357(+)